MRVPNNNRPANRDSISMTPMIDVVFLLIIFFLVSSHLARRENRHPVSLATARSGAIAQSTDSSTTLTLDEQGALHFAGRTCSPESLDDRWAGELPQPVSIRFRIDQSARYESVRPVLNRLSKLGINDVAISVLNPADADGSP